VKITDNHAEAIKDTDAVIDFSTGGVIENTRAACEKGCSVVIGTTALGAEGKAELQKIADDGGRIVFASNMSVGVNLLFHLCKEVASILDEDYDIEIVEMHHNQKKDSPSGTAVTLAEVACEARGLSYEEDVKHGREGMVGARTKKEIGMHAVRGGDVVGDHTVIFATGGERIELTHKASSRDTFAKGALKGVRFLDSAKPGLYNMQDVLKLK
jgi:4-hydroxy-tetrahydrodipicolinate reductase